MLNIPENHPARKDLEIEDAWHTLNPIFSGSLGQNDIFGTLQIENLEQQPTITVDWIENSTIVQAVRGIRNRDGTPEEKFDQLVPLLNQCRMEDGQSLQGYRIAEYELNAIKKAVNELVVDWKDAAPHILGAMAKGLVEHHHGILFGVLTRHKSFSLDGINVAEVILPLLDDDFASDNIFEYLEKCGAAALPILPELLDRSGLSVHYLGGRLGPTEDIQVQSAVEAICEATKTDAIPALSNALDTGRQGTKIAVLEVLRKTRLAPHFIDHIVPLLSDPDLALKKEAILTLGYSDSKASEHSSRLLAIAEESGEAVASACLFALGKIGEPTSRVLQAFNRNWNLISDTEPVREETTDVEPTGFLPKAVMIDISSAMREFQELVNDPERGSHLSNIRLFLCGLAAFSQREPNAIDLFETAWRQPSAAVTASLLDSLVHTNNFPYAQKFFEEALNGEGNEYNIAGSVLSFGKTGFDFLENWILRTREKLANAKDVDERAALEDKLAGPERLYEINLERRAEMKPFYLI